MVVLPLVAEGVILSLEVSFKQQQVKKEALQADKENAPINNIIVGKDSLQRLDNATAFDRNAPAITQLIRRYLYNNSTDVIQLTTSNYQNKDFYDIYTIPSPPHLSIPAIDSLYGYLVNDVRLSQPDAPRGKFLSLKKLGIDQLFSQEILQQISSIKQQYPRHDEYIDALKRQGYQWQVELLQFFNDLNFTILDETIMSTKNMQTTLQGLAPLHSKVDKPLKQYYQTAQDNYESYILLSTAHHMIYDRALSWPSLSPEQQKILLKRVS